MAKFQSEEYSEREAAERRDAIIKRMIAMPPKPHSEMKIGKKSSVTPKRGSAQSKKRKKAKA